VNFTLPAQIIQQVAAQAIRVADVLAPAGAGIAYSLIGLAIIFTGISLVAGGGIGLISLAELTMWSALALFLCNNWGDVIGACLKQSDQALALFGVNGPAALFGAAASVADRIAQEPLGFSLSITGTATALFRAVLLAISIPIVVVGLAVPGLLALLAQVNLVLGAAAAPLLVPGIAWSVTRPLAFGALSYMVSATLRIIILGLVSVIFAEALQAQLTLPGADEAISLSGIAGLWLTALLALIAGFSANAIAGGLVGHGVGALGLGSFAAPMQTISTVSAASGGAMVAAGRAASAGGAAAGRMVGGMRP
jgi:hypothetical protein